MQYEHGDHNPRRLLGLEQYWQRHYWFPTYARRRSGEDTQQPIVAFIQRNSGEDWASYVVTPQDNNA